jgi:prepilin-type N-terminal cleavage/methylation domain-containing protein
MIFRRQRAFTLVELLVVIAIIGILVSLMLPAVQQARMSALRLQSRNNLKQQGLAFQGYHDSHKHLPAGYETKPIGASGEDGPPGWGWGASLLPYLEETALAKRIRWQLPAWDPQNATATASRVSVFLNAAAPNLDGVMSVRNGAKNELCQWGQSHYVANVGQDEPWGYDPPLRDWKAHSTGPFYRNSRVKFSQISDGLSKTVFVGEHTSVSDKTWVGVHPAAMSCPIDANLYPFSECDSAATLVLCHSGPAPDEPGIIHPPGFPTCHVCQMYSPWDGGHVLMGDGSVHFITSDIDLKTWAALSSKNLGDQTGSWE